MYSKINVKQSFSDFILYIFPSVVTMVLVSFYSAIDSWFLAQYVSTNAMAAINIVLPYSNLIWGLAVMFTCGSCALVGIKLGEGKRSLANTYFTSMFWFLTGFTAIFAIVAYFNMDRIIYSLGSTALLFEDCKTYLKYMILGTPILAVKLFLEYYIRLDGRPAYSLVMSLTGFILNIVLDYYTIVVLGWGVFGASISTITSIAISTLMGLVYFKLYETNLKFTKFHWNKWYFIKSSFNGAGEMLTELSSGIVTIFFNIAIIKFAGEDGVKKMRVLSGGEKVRVLLSRMMIMGSNVLMFDEPTDHLDMESITALNNGMIKFPGVILFACRDHQVVQTTANRIIEFLPNGSMIDKITTYDEYLESDEMARKRQVYSMSEDDENDN